jgi:4a-hydroxytetrahydrobiopterin dehydratase
MWLFLFTTGVPLMSDLATKHCIPCQGGARPLKGNAITPLQEKIHSHWEVKEEHHLEREWTFDDFLGALSFTNEIGAIAEEEGHHPDIYLTWGKVRIQILTHKINGLSESDFILAAKIDAI